LRYVAQANPDEMVEQFCILIGENFINSVFSGQKKIDPAGDDFIREAFKQVAVLVEASPGFADIKVFHEAYALGTTPKGDKKKGHPSWLDQLEELFVRWFRRKFSSQWGDEAGSGSAGADDNEETRRRHWSRNEKEPQTGGFFGFVARAFCQTVGGTARTTTAIGHGIARSTPAHVIGGVLNEMARRAGQGSSIANGVGNEVFMVRGAAVISGPKSVVEGIFRSTANLSAGITCAATEMAVAVPMLGFAAFWEYGTRGVERVFGISVPRPDCPGTWVVSDLDEDDPDWFDDYFVPDEGSMSLPARGMRAFLGFTRFFGRAGDD